METGCSHKFICKPCYMSDLVFSSETCFSTTPSPLPPPSTLESRYSTVREVNRDVKEVPIQNKSQDPFIGFVIAYRFA